MRGACRMTVWSILCDDTGIAVECGRKANRLGLSIAPRVSPQAVAQAQQSVSRGEPTALALLHEPAPDALADIAPLPLYLWSDDRLIRHLASDLGHAVVDSVDGLLAVLALFDRDSPWEVSTKTLEPADRARLDSVVEGRREPTLGYGDEGNLVFDVDGDPVRLGETAAVADALAALRHRSRGPRPKMPTVERVDPQNVLDVILGPARTLSDPASKAALSAYDVPLPIEELCSSPSRAATEATRIGYPVRVALASPELRLWDHPDLAADRVDSATRVKDAFRQIMAVAQSRAPDARLLGVTVSATTATRALLEVEMRPLGDDLVWARLGFADAHGRASRDETALALPCTREGLEAAVHRLRGHSLLTEPRTEWRSLVGALGDVLLRLGAFLHDWRVEVASLRVRPLGLLVGGEIEIREASVEVTDAFERTLREMGTGR